jgi:hypothetical protein
MYDNVIQWFVIVGKDLHDPVVLLENVYNIDETEVLISVLSSLKVLVEKQDLRECRGAEVKLSDRTFESCSIL